jgi:hypothetical protein
MVSSDCCLAPNGGLCVCQDCAARPDSAMSGRIGGVSAISCTGQFCLLGELIGLILTRAKSMDKVIPLFAKVSNKLRFGIACCELLG